MMRSLLSVSALLLGSGLLLFGGGLNSILLPVRGEAEGFSAATLGFLGTGWAIGYVLGCMRTPRMVARVGHIRAFGIVCSVAAMAVLFSLLVIHPMAWIPARAVQGFCFAAAAMIVESWLNERTEKNARGRVFGAYTMVNLGATTAGQITLTMGDPMGYVFFVIAAMLYCLALLPTAITAGAAPKPLTQVSLKLKRLWKNSPVAVFAVAMVGISNGAFGTLGAVFGARVGFDIGQIALFLSLPILTSALLQLPVGWLSDRNDRRLVLIGTAVLALTVECIVLLFGVTDPLMLIALASVFGVGIYSMYPVIVAHASDHAVDGNFLQISGGLLLVYGVGAIIGPSLAGLAMTRFGATGLFYVTASAHVMLILFTVSRLFLRDAVPQDVKGSFQPSALARTLTPETLAMAEEAAEEQRAAEVRRGVEEGSDGPEDAEAVVTAPEHSDGAGVAEEPERTAPQDATDGAKDKGPTR